MDFFKELYNGDVYPAEEIAVDIGDDPKYKELLAKLSEAASQAENADDEGGDSLRESLRAVR